MLFAHGPLGALLASSVFKKHRQNFSRKKWAYLLLIGFVGGIIPDIDLFYTYLVDATTSHREFITHTPVFWLLFFFLTFFLVRTFFRANIFLRQAVLVFFLGTASHIVTDGVIAQIPWLFPFSRNLFGLGDVPWLIPHLFALNYIIEFSFVGMFFFFVVREFFSVDRERLQRFFRVFIIVFTVSALIFVGILDSHNMPLDYNTPYEDFDGDHIHNRTDLDLDGDTLVNSHDNDSDGDGITNAEEFSLLVPKLSGVWHDPTDGGMIELVARLGLPSRATFVHDIYDSFGIYMEAEMAADYTLSPHDYDTNTRDAAFRNSIHNMRTWLNHTGRLLPARAIVPSPGDLVFFGEDGDEHLALVSSVSSTGKAMVIFSDVGFATRPVPLSDISVQFGKPVFIGRVLSPITSQTLLSKGNILSLLPSH